MRLPADSAHISSGRGCSLAEPVGSLRQHPQAIEPFAGGDIKRSLVRSGERHVRALARRSDLAEILAGGIEDLNTRDGRDVDPILAIERHAVRAALLARRDVLQLGEGPLVL